MKRRKVKQYGYLQLVACSMIVAVLSSVLTYLLKHLTEGFEQFLLSGVQSLNPLLFIGLPGIGLAIIFFLRKYAFNNKKNKGITEIYKTLDQRKEHLPLYKIPSHFFNGFLTVVFGGSTGIEVSSVVATAAIGNGIYEKSFSVNKYKRELICAGVTAAVAILFANPFAGFLFALEVIARKINKTLLISCGISALLAWILLLVSKEPSLFSYKVTGWSYYAIPFFLLLSLLSGLVSVYFTLLVTRLKEWSSKISSDFLRVNTGAVLIGLMILYLPVLYGDSYHGLNELLGESLISKYVPFLLLIFLIVLKPLAASITLGSGGDGGVFAPSIVIGAFLGLFLACFLNHNFGTHLIPLNFAIVGAGCVLSASLHAPYTSIVIACGLLPNGIDLLFPLSLACLLAQFISKRILPYNVYTYDLHQASAKKTTL